MKRYLSVLRAQRGRVMNVSRLTVLFALEFIASYFFAGRIVHFVRYYEICLPEALVAALGSYAGNVFAFMPIFILASSASLPPDMADAPYVMAGGGNAWLISRAALIVAQAALCALSVMLGACCYLFQDIRFFNQWAIPGAMIFPEQVPEEIAFYEVLFASPPLTALIGQFGLFVAYATLMGMTALAVGLVFGGAFGAVAAAMLHFLQIGLLVVSRPSIRFFSLLGTGLISSWAGDDALTRALRLVYLFAALALATLLARRALKRRDWLGRANDAEDGDGA